MHLICIVLLKKSVFSLFLKIRNPKQKKSCFSIPSYFENLCFEFSFPFVVHQCVCIYIYILVYSCFSCQLCCYESTSDFLKLRNKNWFELFPTSIGLLTTNGKQGFQTRAVHWTVKGRGSRVLRSDRGRTGVEPWWRNN